MKCTRVLLTFLVVLAFPAFSTQPEPADAVLSKALQSAKASKKSVFAGFHASWCGYCKKLERYLDSAEVKPIIDRHFEVTWLTVLERGEKKALENPGGAELMARWSGLPGAGLPFFAFLDGKGTVLATSIRPVSGTKGQNTGFPAAPEEIEHFLSSLKKAAPDLTPSDLEILRRNLKPLPPR